MFEKFGEFDSFEEINRAAAAQLAEGDTEAIFALAKENGIDPEDAEDYVNGDLEELVTPMLAALGKLEVEAEELELGGILKDWLDCLKDMCRKDEELVLAVRRKGRSLNCCMAALISFAFAEKVQVSDKIVKATMIARNGKKEKLRGPLYLGIPTMADARRIMRAYYLGEEK